MPTLRSTNSSPAKNKNKVNSATSVHRGRPRRKGNKKSILKVDDSSESSSVDENHKIKVKRDYDYVDIKKKKSNSTIDEPTEDSLDTNEVVETGLQNNRNSRIINSDSENIVDQENEEEEDGVYLVEEILDHRKNKIEFLIKWMNYPDSSNTWEPEENILDEALKKRYFESIEVRNVTDTENCSKSANKIKTADNWEEEIIKIEGMDKIQDQLYVIIAWKNGSHTREKVQDAYEKAPMTMIEYYESNIKFYKR